MDLHTSLRKNPSRESCEQVIRRILSTEILEYGRNVHFKQATDFLSYFESLYPASDSLTKQVQRAVKSMNMPRDEKGFFIPNKTAEQVAQERELAGLLQKSGSAVDTLEGCEPLLLKLESDYCDYAVHLIQRCDTFQGKYEVLIRVDQGLLFFTRNQKQLEILLESLL